MNPKSRKNAGFCFVLLITLILFFKLLLILFKGLDLYNWNALCLQQCLYLLGLHVLLAEY